MFLAINVYMFYVNEIKEAVAYPDRRIFEDIYAYLKLGVPAAITFSFEIWAYEIMILFSGLLGVNELACTVIVSNFLQAIYSVALGVRTAASSCIG